MKLLVCAGNRHVEGGAETYLRTVLPRLAGFGFRVGFLFEKDAEESAAIDRGADVERTWRLTAANRDDIWRSLQDWRPSVVFNNGMYDTDFEIRLTQFPVLYFAHNYVGTCLSTFKRHAWPSPEPCSRTMGLGCIAYYYPRRCGGLSPLPLIKDFFLARRRLKMLRQCAQLQVASEAMRAEYLRHDFAPDRVVLNPLFPTNRSPDQSPPEPKERSGIVLLAGRLTQIKGGEYLIQAMQLAAGKLNGSPPLRLEVAGDGPELARLQTLAGQTGVTAQFHGWLENAKLESLMRRSDLLAMPSLWPEPFGLLGVEAGCLGVPSVGYAHGGIPDWLADGESGTLATSPPTVEGLADAIVRALRYPDQYERLRLGAWKMTQRFKVEDHMIRLDRALQIAAASPTLVAQA